jgi:hypothetical protein
MGAIKQRVYRATAVSGIPGLVSVGIGWTPSRNRRDDPVRRA